MRDESYTEKEVAQILGYTISTMQKNRSIGTNHPPFKKIGRHVFYPKDEFKKWWASIPLYREMKRG